MEHAYAELKMKIKEVESSLIILQQAVQNENEIITNSNIDDNLEIIIEKTSEILKTFESITNLQFASTNQ